VTRWAFATLAALLILGSLTALFARFLGRPGPRASTLVSVISCWLGAYVLWNFAGNLALHHGFLSTYPGGFFAAVALAGGAWHYRATVRVGRERGFAIFVATQLAWLVVVLAQNGLFTG
jgi:hypothetical protein